MFQPLLAVFNFGAIALIGYWYFSNTKPTTQEEN